jgi:competence protein ComEC
VFATIAVWLIYRTIVDLTSDRLAAALAAIALAASPLAAFDAGFLLSFGATLGILLGVPRLWRPAKRVSGTTVRRLTVSSVRGAAMLLAATVCAEIALAPAGAAIFSRITFAGLVLNFAAIPLMTIVQSASMAVLAISPLWRDGADVCGFAAHAAAAGLVRTAYLVDYAPWLSRNIPPPAWWLVAAYYASVFMVLARHSRVRAAALTGVLLSGTLMVTAPRFAVRDRVRPPSPGALRLVCFDVGQGDATLIAAPDGRMVLVDAAGIAGTSFNIGERVLAPSLRAFGVTRLDALVITHADPDHVGGAPAIMRRFRPREVWEGVPVPRDEAMRALSAAADARAIVWRTVQAGDASRLNAVDIRVLHPPPPDWERQKVRNNDSVVLDVRTGNVSVLLAGDVEREAEHDLRSRLALAPLVVLKAPHHGSATSSTPAFLGEAHPSAVIVSAGLNNRFGHPAPSVVARYAAAGVPLFRTDVDGAVIVDTDGQTVKIWTWATHRTLVLSR